MAPFGASYNPANVMMGRPGSSGSPYLWTGAGSKPPGGGPIFGPRPTGGPGDAPPISAGGNAPPSYSGLPASLTTTAPPSASGSNVVGPRNVRSTGTGPFDPAYRQNLASYAGGQFSGNLAFNPTDIASFPGQPTGGGTAPVTGMPQSLLDMALAGQGFSWTPPPTAQTAQQPPQFNNMQFWMDQFMRGGRGGRMGSIL